MLWSDTSNIEVGYKIERKTTSSGSYIQIATVNIPEFIDINIIKNQNYYYRVRSFNNNGNSSYSLILGIKTLS